MNWKIGAGLLLAVTLVGSACSEAGFAGDGAVGVGQGGAQDFGRFKEILEAGGLPGPNTIDDVGFFAEHKIELPPPTCGERVCLHAQVGHMGNLVNGADCTIVQLGLNADASVLDVERPPLNLALVIDSSGSMGGGPNDPMSHVRTGLLKMVDALEEGDRVSLIDFDTQAKVLVSGSMDPEELRGAIASLRADGSTNISDAMARGYEQLSEHRIEGSHNRMILVSDGVPNRGNTNAQAMQDLARTAYEEDGFDLTTIGLGDDFDLALMKGLAEEGGGSFYYLSDEADVQEVFVDEVASFLIPLATDVEISVSVGGEHELANLFGTTDFTEGPNEITIDIDRLQVAGRKDAEDQESGRRGGGGAMIAEIMPGEGGLSGPIGRVDFAFTDTETGERVVDEIPLSVPTGPIDPVTGWFEGTSVEKSFVMLNIFAGFEFAAELVQQGNHTEAHAMLRGLCGRVEAWLADNDDADIADDVRYMRMFIANLGPFLEREAPPNPGRGFGWRRD